MKLAQLDLEVAVAQISDAPVQAIGKNANVGEALRERPVLSLWLADRPASMRCRKCQQQEPFGTTAAGDCKIDCVEVWATAQHNSGRRNLAEGVRRMHSVTELDLAEMPIERPDFAADPMPYLESARRCHPWLAKCSVGYIIHQYQAIKDLIHMDAKLRTSNDSVTEIMGAKGTRWGRFIDNQILAQSGPAHSRLRASVEAAFTPRNINRYRSVMREVVAELLDEWAPKGEFDFALFSSYFPIAVTCGMVGAPRQSIRPIRDSLETQGLAFSLDSSLMPAMEAAFGVIWDFVDRLIIEREKGGGGDPEEVLNRLIAAKNTGQLNEVELRDLLIFIFAAGYDTSKNMLTLLMYSMLSHPEYWARCAEDRPFCDKVVEEQFRHTSVASPYRTVKEDFVYRDVTIPKGTLLVFPFPLAGRDPTAFADPLEFQPERVHDNRHIAFGRGMHMCLGQHLAKAQIQEGIHLIAQRITKPELAGKIAWRPFPGVWGLRTLPVRFVPRQPRPVVLASAS